MLSQLNRQLAERQNADTQESTYLDLTVNTNVGSNDNSGENTGGGGETVSLIFPDAERRTQWEDAFSQVKRRLGELLPVDVWVDCG